MSSQPDTWDLDELDIPPRSDLPAPAPIGLGTAAVESLVSYLKRVAEGLLVPVGRVIGQFLLSDASEASSLPAGRRRWHDDHVSKAPATLLSPSMAAADWSRRLSAVTGFARLDELTLSPWSAVLPPRGLVNRLFRFCPNCFADFASAGELREPLVWAVADVCLPHGRALLATCPSCQSPRVSQKPFVGRIGFCPSCDAFLGDTTHPPDVLAPGDLHLASVATDVVSNLSVAGSVGSDAVTRLVNDVAKTVGSGNALAARLEIGRGLVSEWRRGLVRPTFRELVRMAQVGGFRLIPYLLGSVEPQEAPELEKTARAGRRPLPWDEVEKLLRDAVTQDIEVAVRPLIASTGRDYKAVAGRYATEVAILLERRQQRRAQSRDQRAAEITERVEKVISELKAAGIRPSRRAVEARLPGLSVREAAVRAAWMNAVG